MRFALLGSGSEGNALLVESGATRLLVDCGFGLGETELRLARLGLDLDALSAVLVTHEHGDHAGGVARVAAKARVPLYTTYGTLANLPGNGVPVELIRTIDSHSAFAIGALHIAPFPVPHDAREPAQFIFSDGDVRLGLLTDVGGLTPHIVKMLDACNALVLECNHDLRLLHEGPYPATLKTRVGGRYGHLDNDSAASLLRRVDTALLSCVVAAHLSQTNNQPELVRQTLAAALNCEPAWIDIADQANGLAWRDVS